MRIERHVFGSKRGYTTLARSPGVSAEDCRIVEAAAYGFGQTYEKGFFRSLSRHPAWFTRVFAGGRRGLTRVLEGDVDDNNRPTLRLITVIMSQHDWDAQLRGYVAGLLETPSLWSWDGAATMAAVDMPAPGTFTPLSKGSIARVLAMLSELERRFAAKQSMVVSASEYSLDEVAALEMLFPPAVRSRLTTAYRSLSPQLPVVFNAIAPEAPSQSVNFRGDGPGNLSPYAAFLQPSFSSGQLPLEQIMNYTHFGASPAAQKNQALSTQLASQPITVIHRTNRLPLVAVAVLAVLLSAGAFVAGLMVNQPKIDSLQASLSQVSDEANRGQDDNAKALDEQKASLSKLEKKLEQFSKDDQKAAKAALATTLDSQAEFKAIQERIKSLDSLIQGVDRKFEAVANLEKQIAGLNERFDKYRRATLKTLRPEIDIAIGNTITINDLKSRTTAFADYALRLEPYRDLEEGMGLYMSVHTLNTNGNEVKELEKACEENDRKCQQLSLDASKESSKQVGEELEAIKKQAKDLTKRVDDLADQAENVDLTAFKEGLSDMLKGTLKRAEGIKIPKGRTGNRQ